MTLRHRLRILSAGVTVLDSTTEAPPYVPRVGEDFELGELQFKVLRVVSSVGPWYAENLLVGDGWDIRVHVFRTDAQHPTGPLFGR